MREPARDLHLVERQLRAFIARVETLGAQIHGVCAISYSGADGIE
jgi:hypothetical protein